MNTEESEISLPRAQRVYEYACMTIAEHEKSCGVCAYWVKQREDIRCAEYRELQLKRDTWHQLAKVIAWDQHGGVLGEY